jgi:hypothetical protein
MQEAATVACKWGPMQKMEFQPEFIDNMKRMVVCLRSIGADIAVLLSNHPFLFMVDPKLVSPQYGLKAYEI